MTGGMESYEGDIIMIRQVKKEELAQCVAVIRNSFLTVAQQYGFTEENAPRFTAFATNRERLEWQYMEGRTMFVYETETGEIAGYYSLHLQDNQECELNNLCVLPEYRHKKIGESLLKHAFAQAEALGCRQMNIGIVEENVPLRKWYESHGAKHIGTKKFDFFPFTCGYMKKEIGKMTNNEILQIAMRQSAIDNHCEVQDFQKEKNVVVISKEHSEARKYLTLPFACNLVSYGNNIVASVQEEYRDLVTEYIAKYSVAHCFETPNMHILNDALQEKGMRICFMAEYFLPDVNRLKELECPYEWKLLHAEDFAQLYTPEWSNALCEKRKELDVLGVGAYDNGSLIGLAACSADCDTMWQIGVDVLPEYRRKGIASALTSRLALEILKQGRVPFYCAAWSNLKSVRNAIKSGFRPAWVEMTAKPKEFVEEMNQ